MKHNNKTSNIHKGKFSPVKNSKALSNTPSNKKINFLERKDTKEKDNFIAKTDGYDYNTNNNSKHALAMNFVNRPYSGSSSGVSTNINCSNNRKSASPKHFYKPSQFPDFNPNELVFNVNDDHKTLMTKNTKLRALLVQASHKLNEFAMKFKEKEEEYRLEKAGILEELERITLNYKTYAEGFKNYSTVDEQLKNLQIDYKHNFNVLTSYQESLSSFLKDYIALFKLTASFLNNKLDKNPLQFLFDVKELIFQNLSKYKKSIDIMSFRDIFEEYNELIKYRNLKSYTSLSPKRSESSDNKTSKSPRSKEYTKFDKDSYNLPLKLNKSPKNKNALPKSPTQSNGSKTKMTQNQNNNLTKNQRQSSADNFTDKKAKGITNMESHIKNYNDQNNLKNLKNDLKELADSINQNMDRINDNLMISKESLNCSNISNVFEKHAHSSNRDAVGVVSVGSVINNKNLFSFDKDKMSYANSRYGPDDMIDHEQTPQFKKVFGFIVGDYEKSLEEEISCKKGDRAEIISINRANGNVYILINGETGWIPESFIQWDEN